MQRLTGEQYQTLYKTLADILHVDDASLTAFSRHPLLTDEARIAYLKDRMNDALELILYGDPRLIPHYSRCRGKV